jgi:hypothetical protein
MPIILLPAKTYARDARVYIPGAKGGGFTQYQSGFSLD